VPLVRWYRGKKRPGDTTRSESHLWLEGESSTRCGFTIYYRPEFEVLPDSDELTCRRCQRLCEEPPRYRHAEPAPYLGRNWRVPLL